MGFSGSTKCATRDGSMDSEKRSIDSDNLPENTLEDPLVLQSSSGEESGDSSTVLSSEQHHEHGERRQRRPRKKINPVYCALCHRRVTTAEISPGSLHGAAFTDFIQSEVPSWSAEQPICHRCLNRFRAHFIAHIINQQKGELTQLEKEVISSLEQQALISENINTQFDESLTRGQKLADRLATFGGSWSFILTFLGLITIWILLNSLTAGESKFDPYPFILLNLCLSCIAALQAPVIMMSQNRQEAKDRFRSEQDYLVNLKAELEIRNLSRKLDQLISHQWERLLEIQTIQTELLEELFSVQRKIANGKRGDRVGKGEREERG
jgi:uncharacterized membrane protein